MLARSARLAVCTVQRGFHTTARAASAKAAEAAAPSGDSLQLNFSIPAKTLYKNQSVASVIIPGIAGEYGVTKGHSPVIAELKAGVVQIFHEANQAPEKFFVSGGFALTHANSVTDIAVVEAVKLEDIDPETVPQVYADAAKDFAAAPEGSKAKAEAQIEMETAKALASAIGVSV